MKEKIKELFPSTYLHKVRQSVSQLASKPARHTPQHPPTNPHSDTEEVERDTTPVDWVREERTGEERRRAHLKKKSERHRSRSIRSSSSR